MQRVDAEHRERRLDALDQQPRPLLDGLARGPRRRPRAELEAAISAGLLRLVYVNNQKKFSQKGDGLFYNTAPIQPEG